MPNCLNKNVSIYRNFRKKPANGAFIWGFCLNMRKTWIYYHSCKRERKLHVLVCFTWNMRINLFCYQCISMKQVIGFWIVFERFTWNIQDKQIFWFKNKMLQFLYGMRYIKPGRTTDIQALCFTWNMRIIKKTKNYPAILRFNVHCVLLKENHMCRLFWFIICL